MIHGDADAVVPLSMGETIAASIAGARFLRVPGAHHSDVLQRDRDGVLREVSALVEPMRR